MLKHPEIIPKLPKDLIAVAWVYAPRQDYFPSIEPFLEHKVPFFVCTAVHNWNRPFPAFSAARVNANYFARDAKKHEALGMIATHWADDGEALFNMTWYGVVFSAAAAWQEGLVDVEAFDRAFDWAFYRNQDRTFVDAIRNLYQVHDLLASVHAGNANSSLFWRDPFSVHGAETVRKAFPVASQMRLLAEQASVSLAAGRQKARAHAGTVAVLELAARRIDYLGMKIQFSKEIGALYRACQAEPRDSRRVGNNLRRIRGMDGLLPSLRDAIHEVKAMYRDAWLAENRPYWLDNVLVRYDAEALDWVRRMRQFEDAAISHDATGTLPAAEAMGIVLP